MMLHGVAAAGGAPAPGRMPARGPAVARPAVGFSPLAQLVAGLGRLRSTAGTVTGTITPAGPPVTATISSPGDIAELAFSGSAGQRVSVQFANSSIGSGFCGATGGIRKPDGTSLAGSSCIGTSGWFDTVVLPVDGTYKVRITPQNDGTGSVTTTLYDVPPDPAPVLSPSASGSSATVSVSTPGQNIAATFRGSIGQRISVDFSNSTIGSGFCATAARIRRPDGSPLIDGSLCIGTSGFLDTATLPVAGTYTIFVDPTEGSIGGITITAYDVPPDPAPVLSPSSSGSSATVSVSTPGQNIAATFQGSVGQRISVNFTNSTIGSGFCAATGKIRKPDGSPLIDASWCIGTSAFIDTATLPVAGTYTIFVSPQDANTGSITVTAYDVPPDLAGTLTIGGSPLSLAINTPGQGANATFQGSPGPAVTLTISNNTIGSGFCATKVTIKKPDGTPLSGPNCVPVGSSTITATLPVDGGYAVVVDPQGASTGSVTLALEHNGPKEPPAQTYGSCGGGGVLGGRLARFASACGQDPVDSLTGAFTKQVTDIALPGVGIPFTFTRTYTSADPTRGRLGLGWTDSYSTSLLLQPNGDVIVHAEDGQQVRFTRQPDGTYVGAPGALAGLSSAGGGYQLVRNDQITYAFDAQGRLTSLRDRNDRGLTFAYDGGGRLTTITDSVGRRITLAYAAGDLLSRVTAPDGRSIGYAYTGGLLTSVVDANGGTTTYGYDTGNRLTSEVDQNGHTVVQNAYGSDGRVSQQVDPLGNRTTFAWDGSAQTQTAKDARGGVWRDLYADNVLVKRIDPLGNTTQFGYDGALDATSLTGPDGSTTTMTYDGRGNMLRLVAPATLGAEKTFTYDAKNDLLNVTDGRGKQTTYSYDPAGNATKIVQDGVVVAELTYSGGQVSSTTDGRGNTTTYGHDAAGNLTSITDPLGAKTTFSYDGAGRMISKIDGLGNKTAYTYDAAGRLLTVTDPLGNKTTHAYDAAGNETSVTDANNHRTAYTYDGANRLRSVTAPDGGVTVYTYDAAGNEASVTDAASHTTAFTYDAANRLAGVTTPKGEKTTFGYDANGNVVATTDPLGNTTSRAYDAAGRLLTETDPLGNVATYTYDAAGNETSVADANGHKTAYSYDAAGRVVFETAPDGGVTSYIYDGNGNQLSRTDPNGHTTTSTYDAANRLTSVTSPKGERTTYGYDANGNQITTVDPRGNVAGANPAGYTTSYSYDAAGRPLTVTDPLGNRKSYTYDGVGNRTRLTDANGHTTRYAYDSVDRLLSVVAPDSAVTAYTYDKMGNLLARTDANGHRTTYTYDADDHRASMVSPIGQTWTYAYDQNGRLVTLVDANGNATPTAGDGTTTYDYDRAGRLSSIAYSDSTPTVRFGYDRVGNRTSMSDAAGTQTYAYDPVDRLSQVTRGSDSFSYSYDAAGNLSKRTSPGGRMLTYAYDEDSRLASVTGAAGLTVTYAYDLAGNLVQTTLPAGNGYVETRAYDRAGRLTGVESAKANSVLAGFVYALDPVGNPTRVTRTGATPSTTTYGYDVLDRLISVCFKTSCPKASDPYIRWTYDRVGNRLTEARSTGTTVYSYDAADRLTKAGAGTYSYDENGNQTSAGSRTFGYDLANRLVSTTAQGSTTTYGYDGDGNRLRASTGSVASQEIDYVWDPNGALPQLALERDGTGALLRRYAYGAGRIAMTTSGAVHYYHYDGLRSVVGLTSSTGATEWTESYEPFGSIRTETKNDPNAPANLMKFAGELADPTGLYYLRARQYDPASGRFLGRDPREPSALEPLVSSYVYANDRPAVLSDPSGMGPIRIGSPAMSAAARAASAVDPYDPVVICPQWLGCAWSPPITPARVRRNIVGAALLGWRHRDEIHYTQGPLRMQGVVDKIFPPEVPHYADCSAFATWTYFVGGARDPNGLAYNGYGYTGTLAQHGRRVGTTRAQDLAGARPGDLVFYGRRWPWDHVAVYIGGGQVVGHGSESGPNRLQIDYRPDRGEIRTYF